MLGLLELMKMVSLRWLLRIEVTVLKGGLMMPCYKSLIKAARR